MKKFLFFSLCIILLFGCAGTASKTKEDSNGESIIDNAKVTVFYFHGTIRCVNCIATQKVAQETVSEIYGGNKDVQFVEIDITERENHQLAEKYQVFFSSLVIANATTFRDITFQAFSFSENQPDKLKELIVDEIKALLTI